MEKYGQRSANISGYSSLFCNFFQQEWPWDRACRFAYNKPSEFNTMGDDFFMYFSFFAHRIFKGNLWNFFSQMPDDFELCGTMCKVKKKDNLFWRNSQLPSQNARTKVRLLYRPIWYDSIGAITLIFVWSGYVSRKEKYFHNSCQKIIYFKIKTIIISYTRKVNNKLKLK